MKLSGGALTHMGVALMLIGVLFSSGYSKVVSLNTSGLVYRKEFSTEMNRDNVLLWRGTPQKMGEYELTYKGNALEVEGFPTYVKAEFLKPTDDPYKMMVVTGNLDHDGKTYHQVGDTVKVRPENTYYAIEYRHVEKGDTFVLFPRAQVNPNMGLLASPDIKHFWGRDLYTHVSSVPNPEDGHEWSEPQEYKTKRGDTLFVNDYVAQLIDIVRIESKDAPDLPKFDAGVKAVIRVLGRNETYVAEPKFLIRGNEVSRAPQEIGALGIRLSLNDIDPVTSTFSIGVSTRQKDWVIMKAMEKPMINLLWIGTGVLILGFSLAIRRRYSDFIKMRNKGQEWEQPEAAAV
jgi:cytochrome c-type biogenesis protein CcmF